MNTKISLTYKDVPYTLEYDRMSIKTLEANGFSVEEFMKKPMSNIELAFAGAFIKNHKKTSQKVIDAIYAGCPNKNALLESLVTMIQETYEALFDEPEGDEGNVSWEVVDLSPKRDHE
jgi:hypothetical protein